MKNPKEFMPGEIITNRHQLIPFIEKVLFSKQDDFEEKRIITRDVFHQPKSNFSENVFNTIFKC